jgi:UDP-N-acetylglucosamine acyltransferase
MKQPLANVHPGAKIAESAVIEPFCTIQDNVEIGEGTWIGPNAVIMSGARIGQNCKIFPGAVIAGIPQDLKFAGEETTAIIGDYTVVREYATISRGTKEKYETRIGSHNLIMSYVHVAHDCIVGNHCVLSNFVQLAGHVEVDDHAIMGGTSAVHQFVKIGKHVMVGGGSLVSQDVPPYILLIREVGYGGVNSIGLRRRGFTNEQINHIQDVYRYLYLRGLNTSQAVELIEKELQDTAEVREILTFIRNSERGIVRANRQNNGNSESSSE